MTSCDTASDQLDLGALLKEISDIVASLDNSAHVLDALVGMVTRTLKVERCSLMLIDPDSEELRIRAARHVDPAVVRSYSARPGEGIAGWVALHGKPLLIKDLEKEGPFKKHGSSKYRNASLLSMPLMFRDKVIGVINVNDKLDGSVFGEQDQLLLGAVANFVVAVLERAKLRELAAEKKRIDADIALARQTQETFLPTALPSDDSLEFASYSRSASRMAGDFYDVMPMCDRDTCVVVGDVCGKGIASALYMARVMGYFRGAAGLRSAPGALLNTVNRLVASESTALAFVTACLAVFDKERKQFSFFNAGHLPAYLFNARSRSLRVVKGVRGYPLGVDPESSYSGATLDLNRGDTLVLYTDGITEASNAKGEFFGQKRLEGTIARHKGSAQKLVDTIRLSVQQFSEGQPQSDDQTILVAQRT